MQGRHAGTRLSRVSGPPAARGIGQWSAVVAGLPHHRHGVYPRSGSVSRANTAAVKRWARRPPHAGLGAVVPVVGWFVFAAALPALPPPPDDGDPEPEGVHVMAAR